MCVESIRLVLAPALTSHGVFYYLFSLSPILFISSLEGGHYLVVLIPARHGRPSPRPLLGVNLAHTGPVAPHARSARSGSVVGISPLSVAGATGSGLWGLLFSFGLTVGAAAMRPDSLQLTFPWPEDPDWPRAIFDASGRYRYWWSRRWDPTQPALTFLMLNPSTADATQSDPTVTRCQHYAQAWGFGTLVVTNLFAYRSTDPRALTGCPDPVGPENDAWILRAVRQTEHTVCAWGVHGALQDRQTVVLRLLRPFADRLWMLRLSQGGFPRHPLYLLRTLQPQPLVLPDPECPRLPPGERKI